MAMSAIRYGRWERKDARVQVMYVRKARRDIRGRDFVATEVLRVVHREGWHPGWRVDRAGSVAGVWLPWEPVTYTVFETLGEAKAAARQYAENPASSRSTR